MSFLSIFNIFKKDDKKQKKTIKEEKKLITIEQLYLINKNLQKDKCDLYIEALNKVLKETDISSPLRICHFLAQVIHESGNFKYNIENLNYSAAGLKSSFKRYFPTDELASTYARKPEKIANRVYANRMGNGNEASGDGWKYRGRGLIQITGKNNYSQCAKDLNLDLIHNPDLIILDPEINVRVACWFWNKNNLNQLADKDDITSITKKINGGTNGLDDRMNNLAVCKRILIS